MKGIRLVFPGFGGAAMATDAVGGCSGFVALGRLGKHEPPLKQLRDNIDILMSPTALPMHMDQTSYSKFLKAMWAELMPNKSKLDPSS
jgi:hypothetical protein